MCKNKDCQQNSPAGQLFLKKSDEKVEGLLSLRVYGCNNPFGKPRKWTQKSLRDWLKTPATDAEGLATLAKLKASGDGDAYKREKQARAHGSRGGLYAFQFAQDAAAAGYDDARRKGAALTGVYFADVDGIPAESLTAAKEALFDLPSCLAVGVSVSGAGLAACIAYDTEGGAVEPAYMDRVHAAVCDAADEALHAAGLADVCADRAAKNGVRWRFCLAQVKIKDEGETIQPLAIPAATTPLERAEKTAKTAGKRPQGTAGAQPTGDTLAQAADRITDAGELERLARYMMFSCYEKGYTPAALAPAVRGLYEGNRPESSRLQPGEVERMCFDAYQYWGNNKKEARAEMRRAQKAAEMRNAVAGWSFDTFTGSYIAPAGTPKTTDEAAACVARATGYTLAGAADALAVYVQHAPDRQTDSLTAKANALADAYTDADAGAIARTCAAWGWDAYGARRFELWLYEMMARAYTPGEKCDGMVILFGAQGTRKTSLFEAIAREMTGSFPAQYDPQGGKDGAVRLAHTCIALIDEFDRYSRKNDVAEIKKALTQTGAVERAAYARGDSVYPYRAVFAGTTNNPAPLPPGEAQARRYWVIEVPRRMEWDADTLRAMLRQAAHDVRDGLARGERVWVPTDAEAAEATARNSGRRGDDDSKAALAAMCAVLRRAARDKKVRVETVCRALFWGNCAETGHYAQPDDAFCVVDWHAPKAQAGKISRMISERCKRVTVWNNGTPKAGYRLADIIGEFGDE